MSTLASTAAAPARSDCTALTPAERESLILEHLWQVRLIARSVYQQVPGLISFEDLVSSGTLGLIAAIDRFDPAQGVKLRTYAEVRIRGAMLDALRALDWAPRNQRRRARAILEATDNARKRTQDIVSVEEVAREMGLTPGECRRWMLETRRITFEPLESVSTNSDDTLLKRQVAATGSDTEPDRNLEHQQLRSLLARGIERMPKQERVVLSLLFHDDLSIREIAQVMGVHNSRVSQIKSQALKRMRTWVEVNWPRKGGGSGIASRS